MTLIQAEKRIKELEEKVRMLEAKAPIVYQYHYHYPYYTQPSYTPYCPVWSYTTSGNTAFGSAIATSGYAQVENASNDHKA